MWYNIIISSVRVELLNSDTMNSLHGNVNCMDEQHCAPSLCNFVFSMGSSTDLDHTTSAVITRGYHPWSTTNQRWLLFCDRCVNVRWEMFANDETFCQSLPYTCIMDVNHCYICMYYECQSLSLHVYYARQSCNINMDFSHCHIHELWSSVTAICMYYGCQSLIYTCILDVRHCLIQTEHSM